MASLSSDPAILSALQRCSQRADVRALINSHDLEEVNKAWKCLAPLDRAALHLVKAFDGTVIHDASAAAEG
jgi:hypothetical protein